MKNGRKELKRWVGGTAATLVLAGTFAMPQFASAQDDHHHHWDADDEQNWGNGPNGYNSYYQENGRANRAARRGYAAGYEQGASDREHHHSFRPTHTDEYKHIPPTPHGMSEDDYKHTYREAFERGYERGYRE